MPTSGHSYIRGLSICRIWYAQLSKTQFPTYIEGHFILYPENLYIIEKGHPKMRISFLSSESTLWGSNRWAVSALEYSLYSYTSSSLDSTKPSCHMGKWAAILHHGCGRLCLTLENYSSSQRNHRWATSPLLSQTWSLSYPTLPGRQSPNS